MRRGLFFVLVFFAVFAAPGIAAGEPPEDHRAWQHGVDLIRVGDRLLLVWGSPGNPPRPNPGGDWQHDVYYAWLDASATLQNLAIEPQILVSRPEAQEPPSIAINARGILLMTAEDGHGGINQQAGLWDSSLRALRNYPFMIGRGGHSGHVASMGNRFLVVYGEGWVPQGGFLERGTGKTIRARIVEDDGTHHKEIRISSGHQDEWPLVAGSEHNGLVVWQRNPGMTLHSALVNAAGKVEVRQQLAGGMASGFAYDVEYSPELAMYVVAGSSNDGGFVSLLSLTGDVVKTRRGLPPLASESRIILGYDGSQLIAVYPVSPHGIAVVRIAAEAIELVKLIDHPYAWDYTGTSGTFISPARVLFVTLSKTGLRLIPVDLQH